ncbi:NXPE family member 1-like [Acanthaster planci]|uniref:NXPE family member 1-like n=1 Tax=Acanthaster planci TaxID=133434 RepID=A0A8B7YMP7_ACAPL|nr:NXPE family member 1-like [Acanthaster planci]
MRRIRIRFRLFVLFAMPVLGVILMLGYSALSLADRDLPWNDPAVHMKYRVHHAVTPAAWPSFNLIPNARNTRNIARRVPGPVAKGLPGRWLHQRGNMGLTSFRTSTLSLVPATVKEGQMFRVMIEARDQNNRPRNMGGDFWCATLTTKGGGYTAGRVLDHSNGSYSVYFFAGWSGTANIDVTLVHPSETVDYLVHTVWHAYDRIVWLGRFEEGDKKSTTTCVLRRGGPWTGKCELSHPYALGKTVLLCDQPAHGLKCDSIVAVYNNNTRIRERASELTAGKEHLFQGDYYSRKLKDTPKTINIANTTTSNRDHLMRQIPVCEPDQPRPLSSGYWRDSETWVSLACRSRQKMNIS